MTPGPKLRIYLAPDLQTLKFATRGIIGMALALYLAMAFQLDRPYWAMIAAVFLQIRPQSGLVIEKGICLLGGTLIGGGAGVLIMALFMQAPALALMALMIWICCNAAASTLTRNFNLTYGFAMTAATASLVVLLPLLNDNSSSGVFATAVARVSEIGLGAACATVVSMLLWPTRVRDVIMGHAEQVIDKSFASLEAQLDPEVDRNQARDMIVEALQAALMLNNDSSAVIYEGPNGPGRARAAQLLAQRSLTLLSEIQVPGRLIRDHPGLVTAATQEVMGDVRKTFARIRSLKDNSERRRVLNQLRKRVQAADLARQGSQLQRRIGQGINELLDYATIMIQAQGAIRHADTTRLRARARKLAQHRDYMQGLLTGMRAGLLLMVGTVIYVGTQWSAAVLMMIMPVILGIMFSAFPTPTQMLKNVLKGGLCGIVAALVFGNILLAQSTGAFEMLVLVFGTPLFLGLMGMANRPTLPHGLGFCLFYIILVMPSNAMSFDMASFLNRALALVIGVAILWTMFRLVPGPGPLIIRLRLIGAINDDLLHLWDRAGKYSRASAADWFNGRMIERIQRLSGHDSTLPEEERYLLNLGLFGLNLGHLMLRINRRVSTVDETPPVQAALRRWQQTLAQAYQHSAWGEYHHSFREEGEALVSRLRESAQMDEDQIELIEGLNERLQITLQRYAHISAEYPEPDTGSARSAQG